MPGLLIQGKLYKVDDEGYLWSRKRWTPEWAPERAKMLGIELTEKHWVIINYIREYSEKTGIAPLAKIVSRNLGLSAHEFEDLFGEKPMRNASKIAGLERPTGCV